MKQLVQSVRSGELQLAEVPVPTVASTQVLVAVKRSVVSPGTERAVRNLASASLVGKARARPDLVRQVISKARTDGLITTAKAVRNKLDDLMPLGYSAVGEVVDVGAHVDGIRTGMRVATGGAGHAEYQLVSSMLAVPVPDGVSDTNAAFATVGSIAMHGIRLADLGPGSRIAVIGMGLLGQITCRIAKASGYMAYGIDLREFTVNKAIEDGFPAEVESGADTTRRIRDWSHGHGVDAVIITAATASSEPIQRALKLIRDRAPIVVVGDVGMELDRRPLFETEATIRVARSYGAGRYERSYEDWGVDYPIGHVRWTEGRNLASIMDLMALGTLDLSDLVTHEYAFDEAESAYRIISDSTDSFGVQFTYPDQPETLDRSAVVLSQNKPKRPQSGREANMPGIGLLGAGNFVRATMLPAMADAKAGKVQAICSATGISARFLADKYGATEVHTDSNELINSDIVDAVMIATPHNTHAELVISALNAGKHVFAEKPLCLTGEELDRIEEAYANSPAYLQVGYNRRHSPPVVEAIRRTRGSGPLVINYRVNAGELPATHWYHDRTQGGRVLGEVCHFIDTICAFASDVEPTALVAVGSGQGEAELDQDVVVSMSFPNGVVGTISYASHGHGSMPKERIEIVGRGHSIVIDDFTRLSVDGQDISGVNGKGHADQFALFKTGCADPQRPISGLLSTRLTLDAADQLRRTPTASTP